MIFLSIRYDGWRLFLGFPGRQVWSAYSVDRISDCERTRGSVFQHCPGLLVIPDIQVYKWGGVSTFNTLLDISQELEKKVGIIINSQSGEHGGLVVECQTSN